MKKTLKKAILTLAAVAISATMAVSAFAADAPNVTTAYTPAKDDAKPTLTITIEGAAAGDQLTVLMLKPGADDTNVTEEYIAYINQDPAKDDGKLTYTVTFDKALEDGTYTVKVGGENITADGIVSKPLTVSNSGDTPGGDTPVAPGKQVMIGDTDDNTQIKAADALNALKRSVKSDTVFKASGKGVLAKDEVVNELVADVTNDGKIKAADALQILKKSVKSDTKFERESY